MFSHDELCRAIEALGVIEDRGNAAEFAAALREATESTPSGEPWGNATPGQVILGGLLARRLSGLLGIPPMRCEAAAADVLAPQRQRAFYDGILAYAAELRGDCKPADSGPVNLPEQKGDAPRPAVRIVADDREAVA